MRPDNDKLQRNDRARRVCRGHGFGLIELLVVIGVIILLLGLLMPMLGGAREATRAAVCSTQLRQIGSTNVSFAQEHLGRTALTITPDDEGGTTLWNGFSQRFALYGHLYSDYLKQGPDVYFCPSKPETAADPQMGVATLGEPSHQTFTNYFQRGIPEGAPTRLSNGDGKSLVTDISKRKRLGPNHDGFVQVVYSDNAVLRIAVPDGWENGTFNGHGRDSAPGAKDGAWSQLDRRESLR